MSNYVKATNFAVKDGLVTTDPAKIIKGTEIDNEYNAIASAVSSKADSNSPTLTGVPTAPTAVAGTNTTQIATTAFVQAAAGLATNIGGGGANKVVYQSATDTTAFIDAPTTTGQYLGWNGSSFAWSAVTASSPNSLTINNSGSGSSSGATFNGSYPITISYNTVGAPSTSGTGATGTWGINITGSSGSTAYATSAGSCTGNAATVTNGVYTTGDQSIAGAKTFTGGVAIGSTLPSGANTITSQAYNFTSTQSIYRNPTSGTVVISNGTGQFLFDSTGAATNNTGTWGTTSDARIKENIVPARNYLDSLCQLEVVNYNLINNPQNMLGFVAQQVETVMPGLVSTAPSTEYHLSDLKSVKTSIMIPMLVQAVKELKADLEAAKAEITALKNG